MLVDSTGKAISNEERTVLALESLATSFEKIATQFVKQSELSIKAQEESLTMERARLVGLKQHQETLAGLSGAMGQYNEIAAKGVNLQSKLTDQHGRFVDATAGPEEPWKKRAEEGEDA